MLSAAQFARVQGSTWFALCLPQWVTLLPLATPCACCAAVANGERSLLVDLTSPAWQPPGWWEHPVPTVKHWTDISVYELHIRDFR